MRRPVGLASDLRARYAARVVQEAPSGRTALKKRDTQLPPRPTAADDLADADGFDSPPDSSAPFSTAEPDDGPAAADAPFDSPSLAPPEPAAPEVPPPDAPAPRAELPVASVLPPVAPLLHPAGPSPLEDRLQRLEAELERLRSVPGHETRVAAFQAPNMNLPVATAAPTAPVVRPPRRFWADLGRRLLAPSAPSASPPRTDGLASMIPPGVRRTWVLLDALTELRAIYWMFFDPRYRLSWTARFAPLVILGLLLTSLYWMPATALPFVGMVIDKVVDLALAYVLYKLLSYEARRYRETAPDLPPSLRL